MNTFFSFFKYFIYLLQTEITSRQGSRQGVGRGEGEAGFPHEYFLITTFLKILDHMNRKWKEKKRVGNVLSNHLVQPYLPFFTSTYE